jgi:hypothetical protein
MVKDLAIVVRLGVVVALAFLVVLEEQELVVKTQLLRERQTPAAQAAQQIRVLAPSAPLVTVET